VAGLNGAFREKVVTFGDGGRLVGVLTIPAEARDEAPHVVLLNSGLIHRVGANRLYVAFARVFAAAGITTLRFDLSGIGDSERQTKSLSLPESVEADIASAIDLLSAKHGASRFVLAGLCSGAYDSFEYALRDQRIAGAVLLDMPGPFRNWSHLAYHIAARVLRPASWRNPLEKVFRLGQASAALLRPRPPANEAVAVPGVRGVRARQQMQADMDTLLARNVKLSFIFTGGVSEHYNHRSQFRILFPKAAANSAVTVEFLRWSDHTFSTRNARAHITTLVRDWILKHVTSSSPVPTRQVSPR
jgi:pimeloyl-ACP methyl ester carboxylesterase